MATEFRSAVLHRVDVKHFPKSLDAYIGKTPKTLDDDLIDQAKERLRVQKVETFVEDYRARRREQSRKKTAEARERAEAKKKG